MDVVDMVQPVVNREGVAFLLPFPSTSSHSGGSGKSLKLRALSTSTPPPD